MSTIEFLHQVVDDDLMARREILDWVKFVLGGIQLVVQELSINSFCDQPMGMVSNANGRPPIANGDRANFVRWVHEDRSQAVAVQRMCCVGSVRLAQIDERGKQINRLDQ